MTNTLHNRVARSTRKEPWDVTPCPQPPTAPSRRARSASPRPPRPRPTCRRTLRRPRGRRAAPVVAVQAPALPATAVSAQAPAAPAPAVSALGTAVDQARAARTVDAPLAVTAPPVRRPARTAPRPVASTGRRRLGGALPVRCPARRACRRPAAHPPRGERQACRPAAGTGPRGHLEPDADPPRERRPDDRRRPLGDVDVPHRPGRVRARGEPVLPTRSPATSRSPSCRPTA